MMTPWIRVLLVCGLATLIGLARAEEKKKRADGHTGTTQSTKLYTPTDPNDTGGIRARIALPKDKLIGAFAIPVGELKEKNPRVFKASLAADGHGFEFSNLPTAKYDLLLIFPQVFFEGISLSRAASTLTTNDWKSIGEIFNKSEPFFDVKRILRMEGSTGDAGWAECVFQEVRERPVTLQDASFHTEIQIRTIKMGRFEDVGPAWQLLVTREIVRQEVAGKEHKGLLPHVFCPKELSNLRVVNTVKDLGKLELLEPK